MPLYRDHIYGVDAVRARSPSGLTWCDDKWVAALQNEDRVVAGAISCGSRRLTTRPGNCHTFERDARRACRCALADRA